jgi:uncharacterized protein (TIGR04255 family)
MKIKYPPLEKFHLRIQFENRIDYPFKQLSEFLEEIRELFPNQLRFTLPSAQPIDMNFSITPMYFVSLDESHILSIFSDAIEFISTKYTTWEEEKRNYLSILENFIQSFDHKNTKSIYMEYADKFVLPREDFSLRKWFNFYPNMPDNWQIQYNDFHFGISFDLKKEQKLIMRLRGLRSENIETNIIRLETVYIDSANIDLKKKFNELEDKLDHGHDIINRKFIEVLSEKLKEKIGTAEVEIYGS